MSSGLMPPGSGLMPVQSGASLPTTTKGDLIVSDGSDDVRLPVGSDGEVLTADSGESSGMAWKLPTPDTPTPLGTWDSTSTVTFDARPNSVLTCKITLQDGKQRSLAAAVTWAIANGVGDLGYDEAASQGNDKFLYFYVVPSSSNDDLLTVIASDNLPSVGPAGYTNFKMCWSTYITGGALRKVYQVGNQFFWASSVATAAPVYDGTVNQMSLATHVPVTAAAAKVDVKYAPTGGGGLFQVWAYNDSANYGQIEWSPTANELAVGELLVAIPGATKQLNYTGTAGAGGLDWQVHGWIDGYIDP